MAGWQARSYLQYGKVGRRKGGAFKKEKWAVLLAQCDRRGGVHTAVFSRGIRFNVGLEHVRYLHSDGKRRSRYCVRSASPSSSPGPDAIIVIPILMYALTRLEKTDVPVHLNVAYYNSRNIHGWTRRGVGIPPTTKHKKRYY